MAKDIYKVPASINRSMLDHEIALTGNGSFVAPVKQLMFYGGGVIAIIWLVSQTFVGKASGGLVFWFVAWAIFAVAYLGWLTPTKDLRLMTVPSLLSYLPKKSRRVMTRRSSNPSDFYSIVGVDSISEDGMMRMADGGAAQAYLVVGSASYLLFDEDRAAILNRVDSFWRKVNTTCQFMFVTTKEPQRIHHQVAALHRRNEELEVRDPDLLSLQDEKYNILSDHVGGKFPSIHQYVILRGKSEDALRQGHQVLQAEAESNGLMIKDLTMLNREETTSLLQVFYQGTTAV